MTFEAEVIITPDADGVHCGECPFVDGEWLCCEVFVVPMHPIREGGSLVMDKTKLNPDRDDSSDRFGDPIRCPACLAAEKAWKERIP